MRSGLLRPWRRPARGLHLELLEARVVPATFVVTSTGDDPLDTGVTLRAAITAANAQAGADVIAFALPTGESDIVLMAALPMITDQVFIDGFTQPGSQANTLLEAENALLSVGVRGDLIQASTGGIAVDGLVFAAGSAGSTVQGVALTNFRNGIVVGANDVTIAGNRIGLGVTAPFNGANQQSGIVVQAGVERTTIGGSTVAARNLIAASPTAGIQIAGTNTTVQNNWLGLRPDQTSAGNGTGIEVTGSATTINANRIQYSSGVGILVQGTSARAELRGNDIWANGGLGIDLAGSTTGVTANDVADADAGPNGLQNFPVFIAAARTTNGTTLSGTLDGLPGHAYHLEFFAVVTPDSSGFGEGELLLGTVDLSADALSGTVTFGVLLPVDLESIGYVTATATDLNTNATSEFSAVQAVQDLTSDGTAPSTPTVSGITPDTGSDTSDAISATGAVILLGTAEPGSAVTVEDSLGIPHGATADSNGIWSIDYRGEPLVEGTHALTITATDRAGNTSLPTSFVVVIDKTRPTQPVLVRIDADTDTPADFVTTDQTLVFKGTADPDVLVLISVVNPGGLTATSLGSVLADAQGRWTFDYTTTTLPLGPLPLLLNATDRAGNRAFDSFTAQPRPKVHNILIIPVQGPGSGSSPPAGGTSPPADSSDTSAPPTPIVTDPTPTPPPVDPGPAIAIVLTGSPTLPPDVFPGGSGGPSLFTPGGTQTFSPTPGQTPSTLAAGVGGAGVYAGTDGYFEQLSEAQEYSSGYGPGSLAARNDPLQLQRTNGLLSGQLGRSRGPAGPITGTETPLPFDRIQTWINESQVNEADENPERWRRWVNEVPPQETPVQQPATDSSSALPHESGSVTVPPDAKPGLGRVTGALLALMTLATGMSALLSPWKRRVEPERGRP